MSNTIEIEIEIEIAAHLLRKWLKELQDSILTTCAAYMQISGKSH